jgi:hypothetical protein
LLKHMIVETNGCHKMVVRCSNKSIKTTNPNKINPKIISYTEKKENKITKMSLSHSVNSNPNTSLLLPSSLQPRTDFHAVQNLFQPPSTFAARSALAATFVFVKMRQTTNARNWVHCWKRKEVE